MDIYVTFWGVRGSIPTPGFATHRFGGNTACIEMRVGDDIYIFDAGSGVRALGAKLLKEQTDLGKIHMFFSHSHWDHIQGFPFFTPAYIPHSTIRVYSAAEADESIHDLLSGQMQDRYFPVNFGDLGSNIIAETMNNGSRTIGPVEVRSFDTQHPGGSYAFSVHHNGKKIVYSTDNEMDQLLLNQEESLKDPRIFRKNMPSFVEFCRDADLLIADGQYTDEEYPTKINWGHPRATTIVDLAFEANIKSVAITHHDPMHNDDFVSKKIEDCRDRAEGWGYGGTIFGAREGITMRF